jgi:hypothetical protein
MTVAVGACSSGGNGGGASGGSGGSAVGGSGGSAASGGAGGSAGTAGGGGIDAGAGAGGIAGGAGASGGSDAGTDASGGSDAGTDASGPCVGLDSSVDIDTNAIPDCEETLLENPQFAADDSAWKPQQSTIVQAFSTQDAYGHSSSGSLSVTNTFMTDASAGMGESGSVQCLPITGGAKYAAYAQYFIATGQATTGSAGLSALFFKNATCSGVPDSAANSAFGSATDAWSLVSETFTAPASATYVELRLNVNKPQNAGPLTVLYDNALLRLAP